MINIFTIDYNYRSPSPITTIIFIKLPFVSFIYPIQTYIEFFF